MKKVLKSLKWVFFWMGAAIVFNLGVWAFAGQEKALQFLGGYLIELSLSIDNLFLFISIFASFGIAEHAQHRVLTYGIAGAIVLRLIFILLGVSIVTKFEWVLYIFGVILIFNGLKMFMPEKEKDMHNSMIFKAIRKVIPMTDDFVGEKFFVKEHSKHHNSMVWHATPLFAVLLLIEFTDILFAIDSVPAVFSVSTDLFIVYTSNLFAILGLRQLFFVLEHLRERFRYVKYGVATILTFTGVKLGLLFFGIHVSIVLSIAIIVCVLAASIILSVLVSKHQDKNKMIANG